MSQQPNSALPAADAAVLPQPPTQPADAAPATAACPAAVPPQPVPADAKDRLFALLYVALGYGFVFVFTPEGWDTYRLLPLFTLAYAAVVLAYVFARGLRPPTESWFWLAVMLCFGIPLAFYTVLEGVQILLLMGAAAYWTLCVTGSLLLQRTSDWALCDAANALVLVPFGNFFCQLRVLAGSLRHNRLGRNVLYLALGLFLGAPLLWYGMVQLAGADSGFDALLQQIFSRLFSGAEWGAVLLRFVFALPVMAYLYGLVYGGVHRRGTGVIRPAGVRRVLDAAHILPNVAACTVVGMLCALYLLFMGLQAQYLFSAFTGTLPAGFTFAEYARSGFFELCRIALLNLAVLTGANALAAVPRACSRLLRSFNITLCVLSLLLLGTAASKMALYIGAYGLTPRRIVSSVFLLWLALVFAALLVWQVKAFGLVRLCTLAGAVLLCALCVVNVAACTRAYNHARNLQPTVPLQETSCSFPVY